MIANVLPRIRLRPSIRVCLRPTRPYHSYDHPPATGPFTPIETSILSASMLHIPNHGFTHKALCLGTKDAGYLDASTNLFPAGAFSLVQFHLYTQRVRLASRKYVLEAEGSPPLSITAKVEALTWERLLGNVQLVHRWQEALSLMAQASNLPIAMKELSCLVDEIYFLSGDNCVDGSWYTKRASLSAIYAATELYMTTDKSPGYGHTRKFLHRRFLDVQSVGGALECVQQWVGFSAHAGLNVLRSKGIRI